MGLHNKKKQNKMEKIYKIEKDLEESVALASKIALSRIIAMLGTQIETQFQKEDSTTKEINCRHIGGAEDETITYYKLPYCIPIRDMNGRPYKTIYGIFRYGRSNDLCYVDGNGTAFYFSDFRISYIHELITWYKAVFGEI